MPDRTADAARELTEILSALFDRPGTTLRQDCVRSLGNSCCGAIALCHLLLDTGLLHVGSVGLVNWVQEQASLFNDNRVLHWGAGGLSVDAKAALQELLVSKGVPESRVAERVAEATSKVGAAKIEEGLRGHKPWAVLKAVASGLAQPFRWIKADELELQIRAKADNKFGTAAAEALVKKRGQAKNGKPREIDPKHLILVEGAFVAEDGTPVPGKRSRRGDMLAWPGTPVP